MNEYIDTTKICVHCMALLPTAYAICPHCGADNTKAANKRHQLTLRTILVGKYMIGEVLGQGGSGITYRGLDLSLNVKIAIKEYYPDGSVYRMQGGIPTVHAVSEKMKHFFITGRQRFLQETQILARMPSQKNIVGVRDYFMENGSAYIVMEYINGETFRQYLSDRGGRLPVKEALALLKPIVVALSKVHRANVIHRDISLDNLMLRTDGTPVLLDFGAARELWSDASVSIHVKQGYTPVEQYDTQGAQGSWTDVYALCATLYKMTTGVTPPQSLKRMFNEEALPMPNELGADFDASTEQALMKGLSIYAENRISDMETLYEALYHEPLTDTLQQNFSPQREDEANEHTAVVTAKRHHDHPIIIALGAVMAACVLLGFGFLLGKSTLPPISASSTEAPTKAVRNEAAATAVGYMPSATAADPSTPSPTVEESIPSNTETAEGNRHPYQPIAGDVISTQVALTDESLQQLAASPSLYGSTATPDIHGEYSFLVNEDGSATILQYRGASTSLVFPEALAGRPVTNVAASFAASTLNNLQIQDIVLPDSLLKIEDGAFADMAALKHISGGKNLYDVDASAFYGTPWLHTLRNEAIDGYVFAFSDILLEYTGFEDDINLTNARVITTTAFCDNHILEQMSIINQNIEASELIIGEGAFNNCENLCALNIDASIPVRFLGPSFDHCPRMARIQMSSQWRDLPLDGVAIGMAGDISMSLHAYGEALSKTILPANVTPYPYGYSEDGLWYYGIQMLYREIIPESYGMVVLGYLGDDADVIIPDTLENRPVRCVSTDFCSESNSPHVSQFKTLSLPSTVESIPQLNSIPQLMDVTIRDEQNSRLYALYHVERTQWYQNARENAQNNHEVFVLLGCAMESFVDSPDLVIPEGVRHDGYQFFQNIPHLRSVVLPQSWQFANFAGCDTLEEVTMNCKTNVVNTDFEGCTLLKSVHLELDEYATINYNVFRNCVSLEEFPYMEKVCTIHSEAFLNCQSLQSLTFGAALMQIEERAFMGCSGVTEITFSPLMNQRCEIPKNAFSGLTSLKTLSLTCWVQPQADAFSNCPTLTSITLGKGQTLEAPFTSIFPDSLQALTLTCDEGAVEESSLPANVTVIYR